MLDPGKEGFHGSAHAQAFVPVEFLLSNMFFQNHRQLLGTQNDRCPYFAEDIKGLTCRKNRIYSFEHRTVIRAERCILDSHALFTRIRLVH